MAARVEEVRGGARVLGEEERRDVAREESPRCRKPEDLDLADGIPALVDELGLDRLARLALEVVYE